MAYGDGKEGVRGWLGLFVVSLFFLPAIAGLATSRLISDPSIVAAAGLEAVPKLMRTTLVASYLACLTAAYKLASDSDWRCVRFGIATIWLVAAIHLLFEPFLLQQLAGARFIDILIDRAILASFLFLYATAWTTYLLTSKRVANTYSPQSFDNDIGSVFE